MKRRIVSISLSVIMVISMIIPAAVVANATTWDGSNSVPELSSGVYQIATAEELSWFSHAVNSGSTTIKGKLIADIYLNDEGSYINEWTPIGSETNAFAGLFDGNGFTIHGVYINSSNNFCGLFGNVVLPESTTVPDPDVPVVVTNVISNVKIVDSKITGDQNVGGLVGYIANAGIVKCHFSGDVKGTYNSVGGLAGMLFNYAKVSESSTTGTVEGLQRTGGIVGFANGNTSVIKCYSDMSVKGTINVGGIVGTLTGSAMSGCFFLGAVTANDRVGGIVGYSAFGNMIGAYAISTVTSTGNSVGGVVGYKYGGTYSSLFYSYETSGVEDTVGAGRTLAEMQVANFVKELNDTSAYFCYDYTNINNGYPVLTWMLETDVWLGELEQPDKNASGVYLISKPSELAWFAALVNGTLNGVDANPAANANVITDILLNISVYDDTYGINEWTPIGSQANPYTGTFNGGGYNIAGVYTTSSSGASGKYVGLFGYISTGSVINTVVIDGLISGIENVGGIAGYVANGSVSNCCTSSTVQGDKAVGGIVGNLGSGATVSACCMSGTINVMNYSNDKAFLQNIGGVVGYNNRATVTKSFNAGKVNASSARYVGGIVGNNVGGTINNSYNSANIAGSANVGGIAGYNSNGTVSICYSVGKISGISLAGMAFGTTSGANVSNCYYDNSYKSNGNGLSGATGLDSAAMTGTAALTNMNMSTTNWKGTAQDNYYYYYPQIISLSYSSIKHVKASSIASTRRVQNKYIARVEIDGRADTFYETFDAALNYVAGIDSGVLPIIYLVRDVEISSTINIGINTGLFGDDGVTLKRASTFTGAMFDVTGNLSIDSAKYGNDDNIGLYIDGSGVAETASGIIVENGATLKVGEGVCLTGFNTVKSSSNPVTGAAISVKSGTLNIDGGMFDTNISSSAGGAIYNKEGTVTISGGLYQNNEAKQGAVLYNDNGTAVISGGSFVSNTSESNGGAVSTTGVYGNTTINGNAEMRSNASTVGGALSVQGYGTVEISGGTISENTAYSSGGALQIESGSEAIISGGTISGNISNYSLGNAVYNSGTLTMKDAAQIDSDNDVYLVNQKKITISSRLSCSGYAATITPQTYVEGLVVLDGDYMSMNYAKFGVSNTAWHTLANGTITSRETTTVAILSKNGAYSVEYTSLADAFAAVNADDTAIITIVSDTTISKIIPVNGDVTVVCDDSTFTVTRSGSYKGVMLDVQPGSILRFGESVYTQSQQSQADYNSGTDTAGSFILDGGYVNTGVIGAAAINVQSGGSFYMYDGAIIENNKNTTTSTVTVSGAMYMYGGTIRNNAGYYGGAVYVKSTGTLDTYGGVIANNTSSKGGDAVYSMGNVTRNEQTYSYWYVEIQYDELGNIIGYADAVKKSESKTDILIADSVFLTKNVIYFAQTSSDTYVTSLSQIPDETEYEMNTMKLDFATYTVGATVVSGEDLIDYYMYFKPYIEGYFIAYDGTLGLNKLVAKSTSGLVVDRDNNLVSGIDLDCATVGEMANLFVNNKTFIMFYDINGTKLKNTSDITTGCSIQLVDTNGNVTDAITLVVYGDVNCDGDIDAEDSVYINALAAGMLTASDLTVAQYAAADVNFDGSIAVIDAQSTDMSGLKLQTIGQTK